MARLLDGSDPVTFLRNRVGAGIALAVLLTTLGGCASSVGPWTMVEGPNNACVPGESGKYEELSVPIAVYELPTDTAIQITGIEVVDPINVVLHDDDYRVVAQVTDGDRFLMPGIEQYPPANKPFASLWESAESPFGLSLNAADLPVAVIAHLTTTTGKDASFNGFNVSYTSGGKNYTVKTGMTVEVPNGPCN